MDVIGALRTKQELCLSTISNSRNEQSWYRMLQASSSTGRSERHSKGGSEVTMDISQFCITRGIELSSSYACHGSCGDIFGHP